VLAVTLGLLILLRVAGQDVCISPLPDAAAVCPTPPLEVTETPVPEPTPTETPPPEPTETPTLRPTLAPTDTPAPRATPTPRPTGDVPVLPTLPERPTLRPGPERARSPICLAAPPPVPDVPGVIERDWTPAERCGGTPEAQATQAVLERPVRDTPTPAREAAREPAEVRYVSVLILPLQVVTATPTPEPRDILPDELPSLPPVQLPEAGDSSGLDPRDR